MHKMKMRQNKKIVFNDDDNNKQLKNEPVSTDTKDYSPKRNNLKRSQTQLSHPTAKRQYKTVYYNDEDDENHQEILNYDSDNEQDSRHKYINWPQIKANADKLLEIRKSLPIYKVKDQIVPKLLSESVTILIGETGSGKSTQIPQFLMTHSKKGIAVTQPRRVAAMNLATRVAEEYGCPLGGEVGYAVRFNNVTSRKTKLKYITDGMLLREMMLDPTLSKYSTVIVDEAHERTILTDLLIGFLKELLTQRNRDDKTAFRVIIMSATLDAEKFSKFFDNAPILFVEGKMYPVDRLYLKEPVDDIIDSLVKTIVQVNQGEQSGDILCFLPGQDDIDKTTDILIKISPELPKEAPIIVPLPLYAALPPQQQMKIFETLKSNQRKVILSTNIAETSVTVPGIKYVIDSGLRKVKVWRHQLGLSTLLTVPISKASATQRAGRAGRETSGKCFRLYKESDYLKLADATEPEILRSEIVSPVLMLKKLGVDDILGWYWLEHPGRESLISSLQQLYSLGALDNSGSITKLGEKIVVLPVAPHLAAVLIQAKEYGALEPVIDIASCLSVDNLMLTPSSDRRDEVNSKRKDTCTLGSRYGDLLMLKELFDIFSGFKETEEKKKWCNELALSYKGFKNVVRIKKQIKEYMSHLEDTKDNNLYDKNNDKDEELSIDYSEPIDPSLILKSFLKGFITNTAIGMPDRSYRTVTTGNLVSIHPSSLLFGTKKDAIMYIEYVYTVKGYARSVSSIELDWLQEVAPHLLGAKISVTN